MSSPSTREVLTDLDRAEYLGMSTRTQVPTASPLLADVISVLPPKGDGTGPRTFEWQEAQENNADLIEHAVAELREASKAHRNAKIHVSEVARQRQHGASALRSRHRSLQKVFEGSCGPESLSLVGLDVPPVRPMLGVREQCVVVFDRLKDPALPEKLAVLAKAAGVGTPPDTANLAQDMKDDLESFAATQARWTEAKKLRDEAFVVKKAAQKSLRRVITNVARIQEGYYRLAGLDDLADRLRLTVRGSRSKKQTAADSTPGSTSEPSPDASPSSQEADESTVP